jgi:hypothetical protein
MSKRKINVRANPPILRISTSGEMLVDSFEHTLAWLETRARWNAVNLPDSWLPCQVGRIASPRSRANDGNAAKAYKPDPTRMTQSGRIHVSTEGA